jgi:D-alanyl-D-alanine carboxypeptidase
MVDEGLLSLEDTVTRWLDEPAVARIPNVDRITLRQLLNHTSGVYDFADDNDSSFWQDAFLSEGADWGKAWSVDELLTYAAGENHAPYFEPGQDWAYSNTGYLLLGRIIERAAGRSFSDELRERLLGPLALNDTFLAEGAAMPAGTIDGYQSIDGSTINVSDTNLSWIWAAGGLVSTTADLTTFGRALFWGGLLSAASMAQMLEFVPTANPIKRAGLGIFQIETEHGPVIGMDGEGPGFVTTMMRHDSSDVLVVVLGNIAPDGGLIDWLRDETIGWALSSGLSTVSI